MYHSSSSSSSSSRKSQPVRGGLVRYDSAPGSLLNAAAADSVARSSPTATNLNRDLAGHHYSSSSGRLNSESNCSKVSSSNGAQDPEAVPSRSCGCGGSTSFLISQESSPAGFFSQLAADNVAGVKAQLGFRPASLSRISEGNYEELVNGVSRNGHHNSSAATGFGMESSWGNSNSISFASPQSKRAVTSIHGDACLNGLDIEFSDLSRTEAMDGLQVHIPEDSVPWKIRAKRGFATHPRSIAERERRTRISGKLKKIQDIVPNMDKQTSYADMLDLAVDHIKGLQKEVQKLEQDLGNCTCGGKRR